MIAVREGRFAISRADGRSNQQVIIDLVKEGEPGTLYRYEDLAEALRVGSPKTFDVVRVRALVMQCQRRLLKEHERTLTNVRGEGYRLAAAREHLGIALVKQRRADVQLKKGVTTLRHVKWEEMSENERLAHQGTLMVVEGLYGQVAAVARQQSRINKAIASLSNRVDGLARP